MSTRERSEVEHNFDIPSLGPEKSSAQTLLSYEPISSKNDNLSLEKLAEKPGCGISTEIYHIKLITLKNMLLHVAGNFIYDTP